MGTSIVSWRTSDTREVIWNRLTGHHKTVYMLTPTGECFKEDNYDGFGNFGETDAFLWLAKMNMPEYCTGEDRIDALLGEAIMPLCGTGFMKDEETGQVYSKKFYHFFKDVKKAERRMSLPEVDYLKDWRGAGIRFPLKFSHNKNEEYSLLSSSEYAENRGNCGSPEEDADFIRIKDEVKLWFHENNGKQVEFRVTATGISKSVIGKIYGTYADYDTLKARIQILSDGHLYNVEIDKAREMLKEGSPSVSVLFRSQGWSRFLRHHQFSF